MTLSIADVPTVTPGGLTLPPSERWTLSAFGVLTISERDGSTIVLWLTPQGRLCEQAYPAARAAALDRWREEYPDGSAERFRRGCPDASDELLPE